MKKDAIQRLGAGVIGFFAILFVFCSDMNFSLSDEIMIQNVERANSYSFFQAKRIRQALYEAIYDSVYSLPISDSQFSPEDQKHLAENKAKMKQKIDAFNDATNIEGKKILLQNSKKIELDILRKVAQQSKLGVSCNIYEIAVILASIALIINSSLILTIFIFMGIVAMYFHILGFFGFA